jgi:cardiolipin synthase A/B
MIFYIEGKIMIKEDSWRDGVLTQIDEKVWLHHHRYSWYLLWAIIAIMIVFLALSLQFWWISFRTQTNRWLFDPKLPYQNIVAQLWNITEWNPIRTWERFGLDRFNSLQEIKGTVLISPFGVYEKLIERLEQTQYTLDMWFYRISDKSIQKILCHSAQKGIRVRIVHESTPYETIFWSKPDRSFATIKKMMDNCKPDTVRSDQWVEVLFSHQKIAVRDQKDFLVASANLTYPSIFTHRDHWILWTDRAIAQSIEAIIAADWQKIPIDTSLIHQNIVVCPLSCKEQILTLIAATQSTLSIQTQYIQDRDIVQALIQLKENLWTWAISLLVSTNQAAWWLDELADVVRIQKTPYVHTKTILIDQKWLLIWSTNLSTNALENNRELSIIIADTQARSRFKQQLQKDRDSAQPYRDLYP